MKFNLLPIAFGLSMASLDVLMMSLAKFAVKGRIPYNLALLVGTLIYSFEPFLFFTSLKYESLTSMNLIWDLTSDIVVTLIGIFYFGEKLSTLKKFAVGIAFISLFMFAYAEQS